MYSKNNNNLSVFKGKEKLPEFQMFVFWSKFCWVLVNKILHNGNTSCELKSLPGKSDFLLWKLR